MKRKISILLVITMLCGMLPAAAMDEAPVLDLNNVIENNNIQFNLEDIPTVVSDNDNAVPLTDNVSLYNDFSVEVPQSIENIPKIEMPEIDTILLPPNKTESDVENVVSTENMTDETDETDTLSEPLILNSSSSIDSAQRISNINSKDSFALQNQTGRTNFIGDNIGEEYIDPMTGNLVVTETDLVLPGVDGLDLNLSRYYSLAQAELYTKSANIVTEPKTFELEEGMYVVTEKVYNRETEQTSFYYYPYFTQAAADLRVDEIESRDTFDNTYSYDAWWERSDEGDVVNLNYYYTSEVTSASYQRMRNDLGAGWSWSFPSVQTVKDNYQSETEMPKALYYHDGKGNVLEVNHDNTADCYFENYTGRDITFEIYYDYDTSICSSVRIDYIVNDSDGTKYYFGPHGELRTIMDLYGNKITFEYTDKDFYGADDMPVIARITDTVGRVVEFDYDVDGDYEDITLTVTSSLEAEKSLTLTYRKKMVDVLSSKETEDENGSITEIQEYVSTEPFLESFTNAKGETTQYYPAMVDGERNYTQPILFTFADKSFESDYVYNTSGYTNNLVYLLGNIVRPHSNTYYNYNLCERNLGHSGISKAYRVWERGDDLLVVEGNTVVEGYSNNVVDYRYSGDYTGYGEYHSIESIPENAHISETTQRGENVTYIRDYYKKDNAVLEKEKQIIYNNPVGNNLTVTHLVEYFQQKQPQRTKITYNNGADYTYDSYVYSEISNQLNKTYGKPKMITEEVDYDTVISSDREKHAVSYTYDTVTGFMLTKSWYQSDTSKCTERYTYNSDNRLSQIQLADGTTETYSYEYTNGKVSKKTTTTENDTGTTVVVENFTSATGYAFPSTVVKTVTANNVTTTETTSYTYDMVLGVVKSMTDNDGNTIYYEYDNIGRITRIIHPIYSTYSAYGVKDIKILPIENIAYSTVAHIYDDIITSNENLIVQGITDTVSYFNVSDIEITDPTTVNTSTLSKTFYAVNIDYYLGTGEIIESKEIDTVEGQNTFVTTEYYYDTDANIITVVDAKGNRKITQYDGAGREVKVTDQFDNYHITEYNISSDGVGFKAQSYFVPVSDRTLKKNVTEYTYDRLGRITKEKAYSDYPDTSVEVEYTYDFAGNVTGIVDANKNLNEDGYTQTNTYDKLNRVISSKNANNEIIRNTYDDVGNIKKQTITDTNGVESILYQRSYDGEGKIVSDTDNAENSNLYYYNALGQLVQSTDKDSKFYSASYNELGVQDAQTLVKPNITMTSRHSLQTNPYGTNVVFDYKGVYVADVGNYGVYDIQNSEYSYSPRGKLLSQINSYGYNTGVEGISFVPYSRYTYDSIGNITSAMHGTVDDENQAIWAATTFYEYDKNRVAKVQIDGENEKNSADSANVQYEYYDDGKLKSVAYPNSVLKSEYVYDGLSRLTSLTNYKGTQILSSYTYTYDSNGNILTVTETVGEQQNNVTYTYDKLNRIATVSGSKGADSYYEYGARGNRKTNYEEKDFLAETSAEFRYNEEDKLYYANVDEDITNIYYSSNGYRYVKQINSNMPEYYIYDQAGRLVTEAALIYKTIDGVQQIIMHPIKQYIWGSDRVLAQIDSLSGNTYYYLYNGHGDVVQITDTSGNIVNSYDYDVWGNFLKKEETIENHFTYFGQIYDETTGLYYLRARYYDPTTGRFTQQDPAEDGYNWYVYGNQNPVYYIDEYGLLAYPGQIHDLVVKDVARKHSLNREQKINYKVGWGRADLISDHGYIWDVKRNKPNQIAAGVKQVAKYADNEWSKLPGRKLYVGRYLAPGEFIVTLNIDTYYVNYHFAGEGVIAYDYYMVTNWETVKDYAAAGGMALISALVFLLSQGMVQLQPA